MKPVTGKQMIRVVRRRGWEHIRTTGDHYIFASPDGTKIVSVPHHSKDLKPGTQRSIMKDVGLKDSDL